MYICLVGTWNHECKFIMQAEAELRHERVWPAGATPLHDEYACLCPQAQLANQITIEEANIFMKNWKMNICQHNLLSQRFDIIGESLTPSPQLESLIEYCKNNDDSTDLKEVVNKLYKKQKLYSMLVCMCLYEYKKHEGWIEIPQ